MAWPWLETYAVLLGSWLGSCLFIEALITFAPDYCSQYKIQPNKPVTAKLKRSALLMSLQNFAWLPFALWAATPLLDGAFLPADAATPTWWLLILQLVS